MTRSIVRPTTRKSASERRERTRGRRQPATRRFTRWALVACVVLGAGCESQIRTSHDQDPGFEPERYPTFAWISAEPLIPPKTGEGDVSYISPIDDQRIRRHVNAQLAAKGYTEAPTLEEATFVVSYGIGREDKVEYYDTPGSQGLVRSYPRGYGYGGWYGGSTVQVSRYTEGTLTIELFDRETKQALWVGWGSKRVTRSEDREAAVANAVDKILVPLPARSTAPTASE